MFRTVVSLLRAASPAGLWALGEEAGAGRRIAPHLKPQTEMCRRYSPAAT